MCWRRNRAAVFIAQLRCTVSDVQGNRSTPDHRRLGGESASSVDKVLSRDGSARCTTAVHAAHYDTRVLIALGARCALRQAACGAATDMKQQAGGRRRRLPVGPGPTCQRVKPLFIGVHLAVFKSLISSAPSRGGNPVLPMTLSGCTNYRHPNSFVSSQRVKFNPGVFPG